MLTVRLINAKEAKGISEGNGPIKYTQAILDRCYTTIFRQATKGFIQCELSLMSKHWTFKDQNSLIEQGFKVTTKKITDKKILIKISW